MIRTVATAIVVGVTLVLAAGCSGDDGGGTPARDAGFDAAGPDADPADTPGQVACGMGVFCTGPDEVCCSDGSTMECTAPDACEDVSVACDDPADCGGQSCCLEGEQVSCAPADSCGGAILCEEDIDCPESSCGELGFCL